jgi:hypothetical protein
MWLSLLSVLPSLASERTFDRGDFVLQRAAVDIDVLRAVVPDAPAAPLDSEQDRICRVSLSWDQKVISEPIGCAPAVAASAKAAVDQWSLVLSPTPPDQLDLLVVWFRFPGPEAPGAQVDLAVSSVPGTDIRSLPAGVSSATPPKPKRRESVAWPEDVPTSATARCDVRLAISEEGTPFNIAIDGCEPQWQPPVRAAFLDWTFAPATIGTQPVRANVPFRVGFEGGTAAIEHVNSADAEARYLMIDPNKPIEEQVDTRPPPPPLPDHPPILVVHDPNFAPVEIYSVPLPQPTQGAARCRVAAQVTSDRRSWAWAEDPCDPAVREQAVAAVGSWLVDPSTDRGPNEVYARFRVDVLWDDGGVPRYVFDARSVVSSPDRPLPAEVGTYIAPEPVKQVPPKRVEGAKGECGLEVALDAAGRPTRVTPGKCPTELVSSAVKAVKKWRWTPPVIDGEHVPTQIPVVVRFR